MTVGDEQQRLTARIQGTLDIDSTPFGALTQTTFTHSS